MEHAPLRRHYYDGPSSKVYGSFFSFWGGWITAHHVYRDMQNTVPPFARDKVMVAPAEIDACLIGCTLPLQPPRDPIEGEPLRIIGIPGGSSGLSERYASCYYKRQTPGDPNYTGLAWIARILDRPNAYDPSVDLGTYYEPVVGGMSGGLVMAEGGTPLGILNTQNGLADLDNDGDLDNSVDFTALADVYRKFSHPELELSYA